MEHSEPKSSGQTVAIEGDRTLRRARELSARKTLTPLSMEKLQASIPDDWQPGEADVDEFLNSIRGRGESK